jgi:hypothetical protein
VRTFHHNFSSDCTRCFYVLFLFFSFFFYIFFTSTMYSIGKTFVYNCIIHKIRANGFIALAEASSAITTLLLDGGTTAHSQFQIPLMNLY